MNHPEFVKAFCIRVKTLRLEREFSQQKLADLSDIDIRTIQRIEQNQHNPTIDMVYSISIGLDVDIKSLLDFNKE